MDSKQTRLLCTCGNVAFSLTCLNIATDCTFSLPAQQVEKVTPLDSDATCPFVGEALRTLRQEVGNASTVRAAARSSRPSLISPSSTQAVCARSDTGCLCPPSAVLQLCLPAADPAAQVLGFVGAPFTLASYIIEGGSSKNFAHVKQMAFSNPEVLHALNSKLADSVADYVRYQVRLIIRYE